jgi:short-subunit dehydrogenase
MEPAGRRVLITGASRGIGEALAEAFARAGAKVALVARSDGPLKELAGRLGGTAHPADLADPDQVNGLVERVEADGGPVDVLVNNAGIGKAGWFPAASPSDVESLYRLNLLAPVELCRQAIPRMLERGRGHVVNISSIAGAGAFPGLVLYASSKAGLSHFTAILRADLKGLPVGTTLVEVGPVPSDLLDGSHGYRPTHESWQRGYRLGIVADTTKEHLAESVVDAVRRGKRHVRLPRRMIAFPLLAEAPRRLAELILTGVKHQED